MFRRIYVLAFLLLLLSSSSMDGQNVQSSFRFLSLDYNRDISWNPLNEDLKFPSGAELYLGIPISRYLSVGGNLKMGKIVNADHELITNLDEEFMFAGNVSLKVQSRSNKKFLKPFFMLGPGLQYIDQDGYKGVPMINIGTGLDFRVYKGLYLSAKTSYSREFKRTRYFIDYGLGLTLSLNQDADIEEALQDIMLDEIKDRDQDGIANDQDDCPDDFGSALASGCPDSDEDGVANHLDDCPDVPGIAGNSGCPVYAGIDSSSIVEDDKGDKDLVVEFSGKDKDLDGIPDHLDECPELYGNADLNGCPEPDSDNDGISDKNDVCPEIPGSVFNEGCPENYDLTQKTKGEEAIQEIQEIDEVVLEKKKGLKDSTEVVKEEVIDEVVVTITEADTTSEDEDLSEKIALEEVEETKEEIAANEKEVKDKLEAEEIALDEKLPIKEEADELKKEAIEKKEIKEVVAVEVKERDDEITKPQEEKEEELNKTKEVVVEDLEEKKELISDQIDDAKEEENKVVVLQKEEENIKEVIKPEVKADDLTIEDAEETKDEIIEQKDNPDEEKLVDSDTLDIAKEELEENVEDQISEVKEEAKVAVKGETLDTVFEKSIKDKVENPNVDKVADESSKMRLFNDRDGDGIADRIDPCPDLAGTLRDYGCPPAQKSVVEANKNGIIKSSRSDTASPKYGADYAHENTINSAILGFEPLIRFPSGIAALQSEYISVMAKVSKFMRENPNYKLKIYGHTDSQGSNALNDLLSKRRANACYTYLLLTGVPEHRINYEGRGENSPEADNSTFQGRRKNRRVVFEFMH